MPAAALGVRPDRLRAIVARWRHAGYAETGTLGPGPAWCWLTSTGMKQTGLGYPATRPALGRLAHVRAALAVRLWLEAGEVYRNERAWWRSAPRGLPYAGLPEAQCAPRGALIYRPRSGHGLEEVSVGLMAYLDP